jgi:hypothetical protein
LTDPALLNQFYNHPIIQSLYTGSAGNHKPSYIPSGQFAQALLDIMSTAGTEASLLQQQLYKIQNEVLSQNKGKKQQAQQQLGLILAMIRRVLVDKSGDEATSSLFHSVSKELLTLGDKLPRSKLIINKVLGTVSTMKKEIDSKVAASNLWGALPADSAGRKILGGSIALGVTHPRLKQTLDAFLMPISEVAWASEVGLAQLRTNIEEWYTNSMERLTGWYKRRAQLSTLLIGLIMALLLNVDSLMLASRFWSEPYRVDSVLSQVEVYVGTQSDDSPNLLEQQGLSSFLQILKSMQLPIGWFSVPGSSISQDGITDIDAACMLFPSREQDIYGFRIGSQCIQLINTPIPSDITGWLLKTLGLLMTGLSISQGAPFWFDILKKIINIRFTGLNPAEVAKPFG